MRRKRSTTYRAAPIVFNDGLVNLGMQHQQRGMGKLLCKVVICSRFSQSSKGTLVFVQLDMLKECKKWS
jgi:hypothetical protein